MTQKPLTPKQEKFAGKYVECGNASAAYRFAYEVSEWKETSVWVEACKLLAKPNVLQRVDEIRAEVAERVLCTLAELNDELVQARDMAIAADDHKEMRAGTMDRAKLNGMIVDKSLITGKDGEPVVTGFLVGFKSPKVDDESS